MSCPADPDGYRLGPILFNYEGCSDCGAQWVVGDDALWVSCPLARGPHGPGEVLRISTATGRVLQRFTMPQLYDPVLAFNADGLWVAPSILTGFAGASAAAQQGAGKSAATAVMSSGTARTPYVVDPETAVCGVGAPNSDRQTVLASNLHTLSRVIATSQRNGVLAAQPDAATLGDSLYFLDAHR